MRLKISTLANIAINTLLVVALLVRATVGDRIYGISILYYATPLPIITLLALAALLLNYRDLRLRALLAVTVLLIGAGWFANSWQQHPALNSPDAVKVIFWNTAHGHRGKDRIAEQIKSYQPDIVGIDEAGIDWATTRAELEARYPGYNLELLRGDMLFLTRGRILGRTAGKLATDSYYNLIRISLGGRELVVILVDIYANPLFDRRQPLANLAALIARYPTDDLIVMGDFNTPYESSFLQPLKAQLNHAFQAQGRGLRETWPVPLPVLTIDHVFLSRALKLRHCRYQTTMLSDHKLIYTEFLFPPIPLAH